MQGLNSRVILTLALLVSAGFMPLLARAEADNPAPRREQFELLWSIEGESNRVYLLGSVHLLPHGSRALPEVVNAAYRTSDLIVFESDLFLIGSVEYEADELAQARYPAGQTIHDEISPELMAVATEKVEALGLPMTILQRYRPWFFAQTLATAQFARDGFPLDNGVDVRLYKEAVKDVKLTSGLTPPEQHLAFFAGLSPEQNENFLSSALTDLQDSRAQISRILDIYNNANLDLLETLAREMKEQTPSLYQRLVVDRNQDWLPAIAEFRKQKGNVLVVVGALHLVGTEGLLELFREQGWKPRVPKYRGFRPPE